MYRKIIQLLKNILKKDSNYVLSQRQKIKYNYKIVRRWVIWVLKNH